MRGNNLIFNDTHIRKPLPYKSLSGFVKCTSCVKFALRPNEMLAGIRGFISFHNEQGEIFHNVRQNVISHFSRAKYFTICICFHKCSSCKEKRTEFFLTRSLYVFMKNYFFIEIARFALSAIFCAVSP